MVTTRRARAASGGIVRHQHQRGAGVAIQPEEHLDDRPAGLRIEIAGGLVGEENLRPVDEGPGERDALLLAAGKLERVMLEPVAQADPREQLGGLAAAGRFRPAAPAGRARFPAR